LVRRSVDGCFRWAKRSHHQRARLAADHRPERAWARPSLGRPLGRETGSTGFAAVVSVGTTMSMLRLDLRRW